MACNKESTPGGRGHISIAHREGIITELEYFSKLKQVQGQYGNGLDPQIGIHRDAENGPSDSCMEQGPDWEKSVIDEIVVFD